MADPISFDPFLGWTDITDPNNIPQDAHVIGAADLLRYENLGKDVAQWTLEQGASSYPTSQQIAYNPDGSIASVTSNGVITTYTYNPDGTVATDSRSGITRAYTYTNGNLTGIEAI
jgi:secreted trypsin-like serine protease